MSQEISPTIAKALAGIHLEFDEVQSIEPESENIRPPASPQHDRGYHSFQDEAYSLPNDDVEHSRLDIQDHTWKLCLHGGLHLSPISSTLEHAVDIGTGTGGWAIDFAQAHPSCRVLGTDLSPVDISGRTGPVPSNVTFTIANANEDWDFQDQKQDFIHSRMLTLGIRDWKHYFAQAFHHTKPGGWVEVQETRFPADYFYADTRSGGDDGTSATTTATSTYQPIQDPPLYKFGEAIVEATSKLGVNIQATDQIESIMRAQGFINIRCERVNWAVGTWPRNPTDKEIGKLMTVNLKEFFIPALAPRMLRDVLGWSEDRIETLVQGCRDDIDHGSASPSSFSSSSSSSSPPITDANGDTSDGTNGCINNRKTRPFYSWRFYLFSGQKPF